MQGLLDDMQWPSWCWVREELLLLSEFGFEHVPEDVRLDMLDLFMGVLSTNINEDAFHDLRNLERASPNGKLSRVKRWQGLVSSLLAASYDRPGPPVTEQARSDAAKELPASVFSADATDFSMGMDVLKLLGTEKYVSPSAARWSLIPMSLQCCLELKDWNLVKAAWRSLLLQPGSLAVHESRPRQAFMVLHVSKWGCLMWPVTRKRRCDFVWYEYRPATELEPCPWEFHTVHDQGKWKGGMPQAIPPVLQQGCGDRGPPGGVVIDAVKFQSLHILSAECCFKGLLVDNLKSLLIDTGKLFPQGKRPTTEMALCEELLRTILPGLSEEELAAKLASRSQPKDIGDSILWQDDNLEMVGHVLDDDDILDYKKSLAKVRGAKQAKKPKESSGGRGSSAGGASGSGGPGVRITGATTPEHAKALIPQVKGCHIKLDSVMHMRWQVQYLNRLQPPYHFGKCYGSEAAITKAEALKQCIATAWKWHEELTGERCPHRWVRASNATLALVAQCGVTTWQRSLRSICWEAKGKVALSLHCGWGVLGSLGGEAW